MAFDRRDVSTAEKGKRIAVDSDSGLDSWDLLNLDRDENLAQHLSEEQIAEEEALEAADAELARRLASEEAAEVGLGDGSEAEDLVRLQRDALKAFSSSIAASSTTEEASRSRPRRGSRCHRCSHLPLSRGHDDSGAERPPPPRQGAGFM